MRIWKYELHIIDVQEIKVPWGAQLLTVQTQHGRPSLWAVVDENETRIDRRRLAIHGTGNPLPENIASQRYLGTFQTLDGDFVGHVFEMPPLHGEAE